MKRISTTILAVTLGLALPLGATGADDRATQQQGGAQTMDSAARKSSGEVRKVDKSSGKVTIKHGPLDNLGMPAMTMVFRVKDPAMLDQMKEGDKINFVAEKVNGAITVIQAEPAK
jgi:Cu(I)/Ag(I) efflux system protein CusF